MHAFVTGGTGFVGAHIVTLLRQQGWHVTLLRRPGTPLPAPAPGLNTVIADMADADALAQVMPDAPDAVFHIAGNTSMWRRTAAAQYRDNVLGTRAVVAAAQRRGAGRLVLTSSISAYGLHRQPINDDTPSNAARSPIAYHRTKYEAEQLVKQAVEQGLDAVILNPCGIIGPGDRHNWSQLIRLIDSGQLPGVPPGAGSFCDVREVAKAHLTAFHQGRRGAHYILAGVDASFLELAQTAAQLLGRTPPQRTVPAWMLRVAGQLLPLVHRDATREPRLTPEKVTMITRRVVADGQRAERELGFDASVPLATMLADCIQWMREEGLLAPAAD